MALVLPVYNTPDFGEAALSDAPVVLFKPALKDGVAPENYHATSIYPEYLKLGDGQWHLLKESRMDCVVALEGNGELTVKEFRRVGKGDMVAVGRGENGEDGIFVHTHAFGPPAEATGKFEFRTRITRETSFSIDYDELYELLSHERDEGFILWVLGPAAVFDWDARNAFQNLIAEGYVHGILAGNALAVHDVEGAIFRTALGREIYSKRAAELGHYKHLDAINKVRSLGSIRNAIDAGLIKDGIMREAITRNVPFVLAGSIRDDGPLPEVTGDVYRAQDEMRALTRLATTVITLATELHAIATGNMLPSYHVTKENRVRPVYFYSVDMSEFAAHKLANRGSLTARAILTNVQDFVVTVERGLRGR